MIVKANNEDARVKIARPVNFNAKFFIMLFFKG